MNRPSSTDAVLFIQIVSHSINKNGSYAAISAATSALNLDGNRVNETTLVMRLNGTNHNSAHAAV